MKNKGLRRSPSNTRSPIPLGRGKGFWTRVGGIGRVKRLSETNGNGRYASIGFLLPPGVPFLACSTPKGDEE
jgi:hypothetical protein